MTPGGSPGADRGDPGRSGADRGGPGRTGAAPGPRAMARARQDERPAPSILPRPSAAIPFPYQLCKTVDEWPAGLYTPPVSAKRETRGGDHPRRSGRAAARSAEGRRGRGLRNPQRKSVDNVIWESGAAGGRLESAHEAACGARSHAAGGTAKRQPRQSNNHGKATTTAKQQPGRHCKCDPF